MSKKTKPPLDGSDLDLDDDVLAQRISETAKQHGIPSLTPATAPAPAVANGARRPIKVEVSDELFDALTIAAARQRVTKRYLILAALKEAGYPVTDADFMEDGRRLRGSRKS